MIRRKITTKKDQNDTFQVQEILSRNAYNESMTWIHWMATALLKLQASTLNTFLFWIGIIIFWKSYDILKMAYNRLFCGIIHLKRLIEHQNNIINPCSPIQIPKLQIPMVLLWFMTSYYCSVSIYSCVIPQNILL